MAQKANLAGSKVEKISSKGGNMTPKSDHARSAEIFVVLSDRIIHEHNVYWTRNNVMLAISTGMLAIAFTGNVDVHPRKVIFPILGMLVALTWLAMNFLSLRWIQFWEDQLTILERTLPKPHVFGDYDRRSKIGPLFPGLVEKLFFFVSLLFLAVWIAFVIGY